MVVARVAAIAVVCCVIWPGSWGTTDQTGCPVSFLGRCSCGMGFSRYDTFNEKKYTVNCTNTGFTNVTLLQDLPDRTEVLIFTGNTIPILPFNVFSNMIYLDFLETIDMSNNHIKFIQGRTFHKVYNVKNLILSHNNLEITDDKERPRVFSNFENLERLVLTNAFSEDSNSSDYLLSLEDIFYESELVYLKILHLEQNEIWTIGDNPKIFCQLPALEQLHLGQNRLFDFDFRIDCLHSLLYIDLEMNIIPRLSDDAMTRLDSVLKPTNKSLQIKMTENPFSCDCRSKNFFHWLNTTKVEVMEWEQYTCLDGYPEKNIGKPLGEVHELKCPSFHGSSVKARSENIANYDSGVYPPDDHANHPHYHGYSSGTIGALSFFLVFTSSLLLAVAYFHRKNLQNIVLPYWDFITRKIGYTGLSHDEAPHEVNV
ncbi:hypothetical protein Pcinc_000184 [Petrolisthes cinctipes]|uniref:LRRCT domain-containing protein n=1 Tax=Petrolisthes cinctipes TaxID=88211 RepID=A0AAE1GQ23_PETCI|nr:hypothetical protein Pcinc_000184 [Petrolisthes cinctipes]